MVETFKKVLAILSLVCMIVLVASVLILTIAGTLAENKVWVYGSLTAFLALGLTALAIKKLQERKAKQLAAEQQRREGNTQGE